MYIDLSLTFPLLRRGLVYFRARCVVTGDSSRAEGMQDGRRAGGASPESPSCLCSRHMHILRIGTRTRIDVLRENRSGPHEKSEVGSNGCEIERVHARTPRETGRPVASPTETKCFHRV